jgi:hypothetical protein
MTMIRTFASTMRTVLMVTVLTPAPLLAEPATTARQMLTRAQAQAQDHAVNSEFKKITERAPILTETPAVTSSSSNLQDPSVISAVSTSSAEAKIEPPSQPILSAFRDDSISVPQAYLVASIAPLETPQGQVNTSSIVTSPAPATTADIAQAAPVAATIALATTSQDTSAIVTPPGQPTNIKTAAGKPETQPADGSTIAARTETTSETGRNVARKSESAVRPTVKKTTAQTRTANSSPVTHQRHARANFAAELADSDIRPQLQRIINRPEVRSLMAQYGLN